MDELRIYYECLEQARHFLAPIAMEALALHTEPTYIEITRARSESVIAESLAPALAIRNPDGIITVVHKGREQPLAWIEFTTQVHTEDHSLQAFNSFIAAGKAGIPLVKVVAKRRSRADHGGDVDFDDQQPYRLLWKLFKTPSVQLDWPIDAAGTSAVRHPKYRACPPSDLGLKEFLQVAFSGVLAGTSPSVAITNWAETSMAEVALRIRSNMEEPHDHIVRQRSTRFYRRADGRWELKFNRWNHSMDPERGMAEYYSNLLDLPLAGRLNDSSASSTETALAHLLRATGINIPLSAIESAAGTPVDAYIARSRLNRAGLIIAWYCNEFTVADGQGNPLVKITWNHELARQRDWGFTLGPSTQLSAKTEVTEDDVTYVVANVVYPANEFKIHSVSYPGAQGDFALLNGQGRRVARKYFDVIAIKDEESSTVVALTESKGSRVASKIAPDIEVVREWRDRSEHRSNLLDRLGVQSSTTILASVAYPGEVIAQVPGTVDLDFVVLVENDRWSIWGPLGGSVPGLHQTQGHSQLPIRHKY